MPTPKRWHPVSRDLNDDPEVWELTTMFGDRALRIHLEVFAILDRSENEWRLTGQWLAGLSRKVRQQPATVQRVIVWMLEKGWLVAKESASDGQPTILSAHNYWKYHKYREPSGAKLGTDKERKRSPDRVPSYPNLPYPNQREEIRGPVDTVNYGENPPSGEDRRTVGTTERREGGGMVSTGNPLDALPQNTREIFERNLRKAP